MIDQAMLWWHVMRCASTSCTLEEVVTDMMSIPVRSSFCLCRGAHCLPEPLQAERVNSTTCCGTCRDAFNLVVGTFGINGRQILVQVRGSTRVFGTSYILAVTNRTRNFQGRLP